MPGTSSGIRCEGKPAQSFLDALQGKWSGRAEITPRGPLPYDIEFERVNQEGIKGVANPGAALHHWTFSCQTGKLMLRFLTTFGGNEQPIQLQSTKLDEQDAIFSHDHPKYLQVRIHTEPEQVQIIVYLHEEHHVEIHLKRE